jgi:hypothetical protein
MTHGGNAGLLLTRMPSSTGDVVAMKASAAVSSCSEWACFEFGEHSPRRTIALGDG